MEIRVASVDDAAGVREVYAPFVLSSPITFDVDVPTIEYFADKIADRLNSYPFLVAEDDGQVVGYSYASAHHERLAYQWSVNVSVYLAASHQRRGIGRALYRQLLASLRQQGFRIAIAGITLPNAASVVLHESFGFEQVGLFAKVGHKFGAWRDVGWWSLDLAPDLEVPRTPIPFSEMLR